jgi:hydrogenase-4 component A
MSHFVFANPKLCIGCDTCLAACAEAHLAAGENPQPRLVIVRSVKASVPMTCRQCDNAPCVAVCPVNALKISNNAVTIDESMCNGCQLCVPACPFGVMTFSDGADDHPKGGYTASDITPESAKYPAAKVALKCDCDIAKNGAECVRACPTDALFVVDSKSLRRSGNAKRRAAALGMPSFLNFLNDKKS